jgi:O-antigen ligase
MQQRIVKVAARPEFWLSLLLAWVCFSALRSWHTLWMQSAVTEALRWSVGIGLTLAIGAGLRRTSRMAEALTCALGLLAGIVVLTGRRPDGLVTGPYGDHQLCASALLVLLPFSVALALASPRVAWRWAGQIVSLTALVCLILTETRSAWAGVAVGGTVFACLWMVRQKVSRPLPRFLVPGLFAAGVMLAFFLLVRGTDLGDPLAARAATLGALGNDNDWQWRLHTWRGVLQMISIHPWLGWGIGHYPAAHWPFTRLAMAIPPGQRPTLSDQAHDFYLQTAADLGVIGLGLYLAACGTFVRLAWMALADRADRQGHGSRHGMRDALLVAALSLVAAQGVDALASPSWQFSEVSLLFWLGLGLGLAAARPAQREVESPMPARMRRALQYCAAGAAAVLVTAQVLPLGLLSPVEAYAQPADWTLSSLTVTGSQTTINYPSLVSEVFYSMTAIYQYTDSGGNKHYSAPETFTTGTDCHYTVSSIFSSFTSDVLFIANADKPSVNATKVLTIKGTLTDSNGPQTATTTLTLTHTG